MSSDISNHIYNLYSLHPYICTLTSAQVLYGLPIAGSFDNYCSHHHVDGQNGAREGGWYQDRNGNGYVKEGCKHCIINMEDNISHPRPLLRPSSPPDVGVGWAELPEVFLSGALNGDERVGPMAVVEITSLLLESAWYRSIPS